MKTSLGIVTSTPRPGQRCAVVALAQGIASLIGTTIEWYDSSSLAPPRPDLQRGLLASFNPVTGTLAAFASFSVGFIARPVGGAVFAHYGDTIGRKPMLVSLLLMGAVTVLMGLLPGYASIGIWAPTLLVALRRSGFRRRRRVGWRGVDGGRAPPISARLLRCLAAGRGTCRPRSRNGYLRPAVGNADRRAVPQWGWRVRSGSALLIAVGMWIRLTVAGARSFRRHSTRVNREDAGARRSQGHIQQRSRWPPDRS